MMQGIQKVQDLTKGVQDMDTENCNILSQEIKALTTADTAYVHGSGDLILFRVILPELIYRFTAVAFKSPASFWFL